MVASVDHTRWWLASWTQIVHAYPVGTRPVPVQLPSMRLWRGLEADLIFLLAPRLIGAREVRRGEVEAGTARAWAECLVMGCSREPPPWPHLPLSTEAAALVWPEFNDFASRVSTPHSRHLLTTLVIAHREGTEWRSFARTVLSFVSLARAARGGSVHSGRRPTLRRTALADLRAALDANLRPAAVFALRALGWPLPWARCPRPF